MYYLQDNTVQDNTVAEIVTLVEELGADRGNVLVTDSEYSSRVS